MAIVNANANANLKARLSKRKPNREKRKVRARVERAHPAPKCNAKPIHSLFTTIETLTKTIPQNIRTVYDILRCPGYKTWAQHARNIDDLRLALDDPSCNCQGRRTRVRKRTSRTGSETQRWNSVNSSFPTLVIEQAWKQIEDPTAKEMYDKFGGKNGYASPFPYEGVPVYRHPPGVLENEAPEAYPYHTWDPALRNVAGTSITWAIDRAADSLFCRKRQNTFWTSLSQGLLGDTKLWAEVKASANIYYQAATLPANHHPREDLYQDLHVATLRRRCTLNPPPHLQIASLQRQLLPDGPYLELCDVTPELWQIIADCFGIELIVIHNNDSSDPAKTLRKRVLTRGSHNARQIFMLLDVDGEYVPLRPMVSDRANWRYTAHMPKPGKTFEETMRRSGEIRSPCVKLDGTGLPIEPYEGIQKIGASRKKEDKGKKTMYQEPWWVPEMLVAEFWGAQVDEERVKDYLDTDAWC
ncbi:uncharacterized protein BP5553_06549 [Venustampulla echinocandica]|uniref:Uncharacterized protein n=1 Tax=Venustampulla echinocandica TaxID=2656787 RepID=A0A370TKA0_9HELO|nr:uncharacterized protein BP5553_06549 [Venustampulla echinocandica]RDL35937.1 hypothetical protein BP5553_06549 [Venustampulla echinocandica]